MSLRLFPFQLISIVFLLGIQFYFYRRITSFFRERGSSPGLLVAVRLLFGYFALILIGYPILRQFLDIVPGWFSNTFLLPLYLWNFITVLLFLLTLIGLALKLPFLSIGWVLSKFASAGKRIAAIKENRRLRSFNRQRRQVIRHAFTLTAGTLAVSSAYSLLKRDDYEETSVSVAIKDLPASFHGFSIGLFSDVHSGIFMSPERMHTYAEGVNRLKTDIIVGVGDFVNAEIHEVHPYCDAFKVMSAPEGMYGVLGNHDYHTRQADNVAKMIENCGMRILRNESLRIRRGNDEIAILGMDDTGIWENADKWIDRLAREGRAGMEEIKSVPRILLVHRPYFFWSARTRGIDLTLAGHTHGGQVVLGKYRNAVLAPARMTSPYVAGLYSEEGGQMYISRGIGTVGVPIRLNCPPEITRIELVPAPPAS